MLRYLTIPKFAFWTGLRTSELVALNWSDIDFLNREIRVTKTLIQAAEKLEATKTRHGRRIVKLLEASPNQSGHEVLQTISDSSYLCQHAASAGEHGAGGRSKWDRVTGQ